LPRRTNTLRVLLPTEDALDTLCDALALAGRLEQRWPRYDLLAASDELRAWIDDERQSTRATSRNWLSLLGDVVTAIDACGTHLAEALAAAELDLPAEIRDVRSAIKERGKPPDQALRRRLRHVVDEVSRLSATAEARLGALEDAVVAAESGFASALPAAHRLVALAGGTGREEHWFSRDVETALSGSRDDNRTTVSERLENARVVVRRTARLRTSVVIWLRIEYADVRWPPTLRLGPSVTLFQDGWLGSVLAAGGTQLRDHAPEAVADPAQLAGIAPEFNGAGGGEEHPAAVIRVEFHNEFVGRARARAIETAEAIAGLACLYGAHPGTWIVGDAYWQYVDGEEAGAGFSADEGRRVPAFPALVLQGDHAALELRQIADRLGAHLPITDPEVEEAGRLLHWLRQARLSSSPPRLLLHERVLEQVSGWAGVDDLGCFVSDYLQPEWVHGRMRRSVYSAAVVTQWILNRDEDHHELLAQFCDRPHEPRSAINLRSFLAVASSAHAAVKAAPRSMIRDNSVAVSRLAHVSEAVASPRVRKAWLLALLEEFSGLERRRRRTRNGLVHGGPLTSKTVESVVDFAEGLAVTALGASIEGRLLERRDLVDHFLTERSRYERAQHRLRNGAELADVLFPADS
jgi:hypothetical protein